MRDFGAKSHMSVRDREMAAANQKIATNFLTHTTMLRTLGTPTSVQQPQSPKIDGQHTDQLVT